MRTLPSTLVLTCSALLIACGGSPQTNTRDASTGQDAQTLPQDAGAPPDAATLPDAGLPEDAGQLVTVVLMNQGQANTGGHTPRGFRGQGAGLFVGDNLNPNFPEGDGVQLFVGFDLSTLPAGTLVSAELRSANAHVSGNPLMDLGALSAEEIRYESFSSVLWDAPVVPGGHRCEFATSRQGPFACEVGPAVAASMRDAHARAQFRLRLAQAGDGDGAQDLVLFYTSESNRNSPGIFELEVTLRP